MIWGKGKEWIFQKLLHYLEEGSLFELYQLQIFIRRMLEDPKRIQAIRAQLKPSQVVHYVDSRTQQEIEATVLDLGKTYVGVRNCQDGKAWKIPYYMFKVQAGSAHSDFSGFARSNKVDRLTLRIGEQVGFVNRQGVTLSGTVIKLNPKSATIKVSTGIKWRVSYHCLFYVISGEVNHDPLIDASVVLDGVIL